MKNKLLIYDSSNGYKRFIKINFNTEFDCKSFFEYKRGEDIDYNDFVAVIFIVNETVELVDMLRVYKTGALIFLGTRVLQIGNALKELEDTIFLDLQESRQEMIDIITFNLRLSGASKVG